MTLLKPDHSESSIPAESSTASSGGDTPPAEPPRKPAKKAAPKSGAKKAGGKKSGHKKAASKTSGRSVPGGANGKSLVIVESPAKAKTINKYLGSAYIVKASVGHVRDLPKSKLGIDIEKDFTPQYLTIRGKKDVINDLKRASKGAKAVYLATDPDREGEAIAWHLQEGLKLNPAITRRVVFNEITKSAVQRAFEQPRDIDINLVNSQQARRILDRLVGYSISPILWRKLAKGLSAGRVQSVAQRLVCEREADIEGFKPEEYWTLSAYLLTAADAKGFKPAALEHLRTQLKRLHSSGKTTESDDAPKSEENGADAKGEEESSVPDHVFRADLRKWKGEAPQVTSEAEAKAVIAAVEAAPFRVIKVESKERRDFPKPPFITSTLQQAASGRIGFTARRTMRTAQQLYEGVDLGAEGSTGLITYMRTDSVHLSDFAVADARDIIKGSFGERYLPEKGVFYKTSSKAQAAHEAIRPTSAFRTPDSVRAYLSPDQFKLYRIIWERFVTCQMNPAIYEVTTVDIEAGDAEFRVTGRRLLFDGYTIVSGRAPGKGEQNLPKFDEGQDLVCGSVNGDQHFTQPPPRYTEASLVKTLEELGIGRPSTYAAIISTIVDRGYARLDARRFFATELGRIVNELLVGNFSRIVDTEFTAKMEAQLDKIEEGNLDWVDVMRNFNELFQDELAAAEKKIETIKGTPAVDAKGDAVHCPLCEGAMVLRWSKNGKFFGCAAYPECKGTLPLGADGNPIALRKEDVECPECSEAMVVRIGKRGPFLGCSTFPKCRGTRALESTKSKEEKEAERAYAGLRCNKCDSPMAVRIARGKPFLGCTAYPKCRNATSLKKAVAALETGEMRIDEKAREEELARITREEERQQSINVV